MHITTYEFWKQQLNYLQYNAILLISNACLLRDVLRQVNIFSLTQRSCLSLLVLRSCRCMGSWVCMLIAWYVVQYTIACCYATVLVHLSVAQ